MTGNAYCTLFDSNYFSRGVAMCESLVRHSPGARIYLFAFDVNCERAARALRLPGVTVVPLRELEDEALAAARLNRGWREYFWTCTPATIRYVINRFGEAACTYVDADTYFFSSPAPLHEELDGYDAMLTEHRFSPTCDSTATSGVYNVQFMPFRNTARGRAALEWWYTACLQSCELNPAEGKCGDQKYLDDWPTRFHGIRILQHLGGGVAPWNVQQYKFAARDGRLVGEELVTGTRFDLVFYHFHGLKLTQRGHVHLTNPGYPLAPEVVALIYRPYIRKVLEIGKRIRASGLEFDPHGTLAEPAPGLRARLGRLARKGVSYLRGGFDQEAHRVRRIRDLTR
jgi:hypothetical protein